MGLFDEQIRLRKERDQEAFEDSIFEMASVVGKRGAGGMRDRRVVTRAAIDELLKYYGVKPVEIPRSVETMEDHQRPRQQDAKTGCRRPRGAELHPRRHRPPALYGQGLRPHRCPRRRQDHRRRNLRRPHRQRRLLRRAGGAPTDRLNLSDLSA